MAFDPWPAVKPSRLLFSFRGGGDSFLSLWNKSMGLDHHGQASTSFAISMPGKLGMFCRSGTLPAPAKRTAFPYCSLGSPFLGVGLLLAPAVEATWPQGRSVSSMSGGGLPPAHTTLRGTPLGLYCAYMGSHRFKPAASWL